MGLDFEWDGTKANENTKKHGVAFDEALTVFSDPLARVFDDPDHSRHERREIMRSLEPAALVGRLFH
jgi:uncharacterized protein